MEITLQQQFCSKAGFRPGQEGVDSWIERIHWQNQYGSGRSLVFNLIFFCLTAEIYFPGRNVEVAESGELPEGWQTGTVQEFLGLTDEENAEVEARLEKCGLRDEDGEPVVWKGSGYLSRADMLSSLDLEEREE